MIEKFLDKIENDKNPNMKFLSYTRFVCIILVIFNHILINVKNDFHLSIDYNIINFNYLVNYLLFMVTGYSYMKSKYHISIRMALVTIFKYYFGVFLFSILFCFLEIYYKSNYIFNYDMIHKTLYNAIHFYTWDHLWYMYVLMYVYLLLPFLSYIYKSENKYILPTFTLLLFLTIVFRLNVDFGIKHYFFHFTPFNNVLFCVTFGAFAYKYNIFKFFHKSIILLLFVILAILYFKFGFGKYNYYIFLVTIVLFSIFKELCTYNSKLLNNLSKYTFLIYIIHVLFIHLLTKVFVINPLKYGYLGVFITSFLVYLLSFIIAVIVKKVPFIKDLY